MTAPTPDPTAAPSPPASSSPRRRWRAPELGRAGEVGQSAAGLILGFLFWAWVALPLLRGGPDEVRRVFLAKWLNKDEDGNWLP